MNGSLRKQSGSRNWYFCYRENGQQKTVTTKETNKKKAEAWVEQFQAKRTLGLNRSKEIRIYSKTLSEVANDFYIVGDKSKGYIRVARSAINIWIEIVGDKYIQLYNYNDCIKFVTTLKQKKIIRKKKEIFLSQNTLANYTRTLHSFFEWVMLLHDECGQPYLTKNPIVREPTKQMDVHPTAQEDIEIILSYLKEHDMKPQYDLLGLTYYMAFRITEAIELRVEDIDFENDTIKLISKNGKLDEIPIPKDALAFIKQMDLPPGGKISRYRNYDGLKSIWRRINKTLGTDCRLHGFRKARATWLANNGCDFYFLSKFMRHSSPAVTAQYYTRVQMDKMRASMNDVIDSHAGLNINEAVKTNNKTNNIFSLAGQAKCNSVTFDTLKYCEN